MKAWNFSHPLRRNIALLTLHNILQNVLFVLPVIVPYFHDALGLSFSQFMLGEVAYAATVVAMEVPGGYLADHFPRRIVLGAGSFVATAGFGLLLTAHGFAQAVASQMLIGVGLALVNGTNSALLYDTLLSWRLTRHYRRLEGLRAASGFYAVGLAALGSGLLYAINIRLPLAFDTTSEALAGVVALFLIEPRLHRSEERRNAFVNMAQTVRYVVRGHREVGALVLFCGFLFGATQAGFWSQQPYYLARGVRPEWFGTLAFIGFMLAGFASQHGHRIERHLPWRAALALTAGAVAVCYAVAGFAASAAVIPLLYVSSVAYGFAMPVISDAINARIDSTRRASILSTASVAGRIVFVPVGIGVAALSRHLGIDWTLVILSGFVALGACTLIPVFRQRTR